MKSEDRAPGGRGTRDYAKVRNSVRDGDLLLFQGKTLPSRIIRRFSGSKYSHAGIAMWWQPPGCRPRLMVFEAVRRGIVCSPASKAVDEYSGRVDLFAIKPEYREAIELEELFENCLEHLGKPFGFRGILGYGVRKILGTLTRRKDEDDPHAMFCSWYVSLCYRMAGQDPHEQLADASTSPGALAGSEVFQSTPLTIHYDESTASGRFVQRSSAPDAAA